MLQNDFIIVLDFDGTVVKHAYPAVGEDIGAVPVLRKLVSNGCKLILSTMRSRDSEGTDTLQPAVDWFAEHNLPLYGINENPAQKEWTSSPKAYGNLYIDDGALGAPLKVDDCGSVYMDWSLVAAHLYYKGLLTDYDLLDLVSKGDVHLEVQM